MRPPRAVFIDYPLGHTAGKPEDPENQFRLLGDALAAFTSITRPGELIDLGYQWQGDDDWKDAVMRPSPQGRPADDTRNERLGSPQYQHREDEARLEAGCPTCVFLDDGPA